MNDTMLHTLYLSELVRHLSDIDETKKDVNWYIEDPIWSPWKGKSNRHSICDLILIHDQGYAIPIEMKGSYYQQDKAYKQINEGKKFINEELFRPCPYGKFVVYDKGNYEYEKISFTNHVWQDYQTNLKHIYDKLLTPQIKRVTT